MVVSAPLANSIALSPWSVTMPSSWPAAAPRSAALVIWSNA
jgi:hypothetical protein